MSVAGFLGRHSGNHFVEARGCTVARRRMLPNITTQRVRKKTEVATRARAFILLSTPPQLGGATYRNTTN